MKTRRFSRSRGFSLVEMLTVISLIGVITAIAVELVPDINGSAHNAAAMRNAQNLASTFSNAQIAGLDFFGTDLADTISNVVDGGSVTEVGSPFNGTHFSVPELDNEEQTRAEAYLEYNVASRTLSYNQNKIP